MMEQENLENQDQEKKIDQNLVENQEAQTPDENTDQEKANDESHQEDVEHHAEEKDYTSFSLEELLKEAKELSTVEDLNSVDRNFKAAKEHLDKLAGELEADSLKKYTEDNETEEGFEFKAPSEVSEFNQLFKDFQAKRKSHFSKVNQERDDNLNKKQKILNEIKELIESVDQKGTLNRVKELQTQWKEIGSVPQASAENLYKSYSALLDRFYDMKSIEYDLKELDRKKNLKHKLELCDKAEGLVEIENINQAVIELGKLHDEFKSVGPVPREEQDVVWNRFKVASDKLYDKKRAFAEEFKAQLKENMIKKQTLCLKIEEYLTFDSDRIKAWNEKTKELLEIQKEWETIGQLPKEVAKDINKQFWGNFKAFFANKGKFFEKLEGQRAENLKKKEELVAKAEELSQSSEWRETADKLKRLQAEWKKIGPVPEKFRDEVFEKFKKACDYFFEQKRAQRSSKELEFQENLKKKQEICKKIEELAAQKSEDLDAFHALKKEFMAIGYVPIKDKDAIADQYFNVIEVFVDATSLEDNAKEQMKLEAQVEVYQGAPNAGNKLYRKEQGLKKKIQNIESDISLWQNNLQFFSNSKTADKLIADFNSKIEEAKEELSVLKKQLKIIQNVEVR